MLHDSRRTPPIRGAHLISDRLRPVLTAVLAAAAYFAAPRLGYALAIPRGLVTLWFPSGIMLGLLVVSSRADWPALAVGALAGSIASDVVSALPIGVAVAAGFANVAESLIAAWYVTSRVESPVSLNRLRNVLELTLGAAIVVNSVTSIFGAAVLHLAFGAGPAQGWLVWWTGDGLGMLVVAPVVVAWSGVSLDVRRISRSSLIEGAAVLITLVVSAIVGLGTREGWASQPGAYLTIPPLLWAALRFGPVGAASGALVLASFALIFTTTGVGPFAGAGQSGIESAAQVYAYLSVTTLAALIPAAIREERKAASGALQASEERMRFAMQAARVGMWEVDRLTGEARWSDILEALHGLAPGAFEGTYTAFVEHIHADDRASVLDAIDTATRNHTGIFIVYRSVWPDGTTHWISGAGRTFYDRDGKPVRAAGIALDITGQRALEEQFRQSQKMQAIGQLAGGVAHDFNNILTAIQGYASFVSDSLGADSPHHSDVAEIRRASERGASLTRQLLAFSRRQVLAPQVLDLGNSLTAIRPMLGRLIGAHIDIVMECGPDLRPIRADPGQIEQVILNLSLNARDAMPDGGTLRLALSNHVVTASSVEPIGLAAGVYVRLEVTDTGAGMDAETLSRVFEPFFTTKPQGQGTGIGLATVYGIVTQSGGGVHVESEPGRGSTFHVYLPAVEAPLEPRLSGVHRAAEGTETVLVVEDDPALRTMVCRVLDQHGYTTLSTSTPSEAIRMAGESKRPIDLLLSDLKLPEMNGRMLAEVLAPRYPKMRVLHMSGHTDDSVVRRDVLEGETLFLQKPFTHRDLIERVRETLDRRH